VTNSRKVLVKEDRDLSFVIGWLLSTAFPQIIRGRQHENAFDHLAEIRPEVPNVACDEMGCSRLHRGQQNRHVLIRYGLCITQKDFARRLGMGQGHVYLYGGRRKGNRDGHFAEAQCHIWTFNYTATVTRKRPDAKCRVTRPRAPDPAVIKGTPIQKMFRQPVGDSPFPSL
jgi:hypothetical protein